MSDLNVSLLTNAYYSANTKMNKAQFTSASGFLKFIKEKYPPMYSFFNEVVSKNYLKNNAKKIAQNAAKKGALSYQVAMNDLNKEIQKNISITNYEAATQAVGMTIDDIGDSLVGFSRFLIIGGLIGIGFFIYYRLKK